MVPAAVAVAVAAAIVLVLATAPRGSSGVRARPVQFLESVPVVIDGAEREAFVAALSGGRTAGLAAWLDLHGGLVPGGIGLGTRARTIERHGIGPQTLSLDAIARRATDQRLTVVLVTDRAADVTWVTTSATGARQGQTGRQDGGTPSVGAVSFADSTRPGRTSLEVPQPVRWGLVAVFSD